MEQIGGYVLESKLGEGGMGAVYRASHPRFPGRQFALKVLLGDAAEYEDNVERFDREMKALSIATAHENVVRIFGGAVEGERPFYVMELVEGLSLDKLARGTPLEPARAARILHAVADAMAHVHEHGVIHRDLKPANVIVERDDRPRVCDFGLARLAGASRLTRTGVFLGTPSYAAPEQLDGRSHEADARCDVYALGATLYFALVGAPPFKAADQHALVRKVLTEPAPKPSRSAPGVPRDLDAICLHALEKEAADRYASAAEMRDDLARFIAGETIAAQVPTSFERATRYARRRRRELAIVLLGAIILLLATGAYLLIRKQRTESQKHIDEALAADLRAPRLADAVQKLEGRRAEGASWTALEAGGRELDRRREALGKLRDAFSGMPRSAEVEALLEQIALETAGDPAAIAGFADKLLAGRDAVLEDFAAAQELAPAFLRGTRALSDVRAAACGVSDPASRLVSILATIAERGGPRAAFGAGRLGALAALETRAREELRAIAGEPGPLAGRAAGLLMDASLAAGEPERAHADLESLAALATEDRASFKRVLDAPLDAAGFRSLLPLDGERRVAELERYFARAKAPAGVEHPELASLKAARVASRDRLPGNAFRESTVAQKCAAEAEAILIPLFKPHNDREFNAVPLAEIDATFAKLEEAYHAKVKQGLMADPTCGAILFRAATPMRKTLSTAVFLVLASRDEPGGTFELAECFNAGDREISRTGWSAEYYDEKVWELAGPEPWKEFDARLDADVKNDPLAALLPADERDEAILVCRALYRLDVLAHAEPPGNALDEKTRTELAFDALRGLDALRRLRSPALVPFRARARRFAFGGSLEGRLAEVDLRRALDWGQEMRRLREAEPAPHVKIFFEAAFYLLLVAADYAAEDPRAVAQGLHLALYDELVKHLRPSIERERRESAALNYLGVRAISKKLRDALEADPARRDWKQDFRPR